MAADLADCVARVGRHTMAISLLTVSNSDDTLAVAIPSYVIDAPIDDRVVAFCSARAVWGAIPDTDNARDIAGSAVEARGTEAGDGGEGSMLGVLGGNGRSVNGAQEDGLVGCVGYSLALGIGGQRSGLAAGGGGEGGVDAV